MFKDASGLKGRNLKRINTYKSIHLVADYIEDYSALRQLEAFKIFENDLKSKMNLFMSQYG